MNMRKVILASASPRRKELLRQVGVDFETLPAVGEEITTKEDPAEAVQELALQKASEAASRLGILARPEAGAAPMGKDLAQAAFRQGDLARPEAGGEDPEEFLILGADTVVACGGAILGKPRDEADAVSMLTRLSGRTHSVFTGVALIYGKDGQTECHTFYEETKVTMYPMSMAEIAAYVATGEPMDKAGAYGIQGKCAIYIEKIQGDYNNVVGLPVARIYQEMKKLGIAIF